MSRLRALSFVCFMASIAALSTASTQASSQLKCDETACNMFIECEGSAGCGCTCDGINPCSPPPEAGYGYCAILYSAD